jgi:large subunit ribosomal protein L6
MSRLGKLPVAVPSGVEVSLSENMLTVKGPKATLTRTVRPKDVSISIEDNQVTISPNETDLAPALWGTYAAHVRNMVKGVTEGFTKVLEIEGVGYRAELKGNELVLNVGFSHSVPMAVPEGLTVTVEKNVITITGADKELLGQFAADVRAVRPPEPYKGKGIRYQGEFIIRKQGKKAV